jgi:predicted nucleotidyltransferase
MYLKEKDIQLIRDYFAGKPVLKAYLFGSYSRREADNDSDIDILVDLDYSHHIGLGFVQMKLDLEQQLHKTVDLVSSQAISKRLLPFINKDKQLIYESE